MRLVSSVLAVLAVTSSLGAQTSQGPVFRGGIEIIEVDVSVVDDRGRQISDLRRPEFTVTIDGRPRAIVSAEFISQRPAERSRQAEASRLADTPYSSNVGSVRGRLIVLAVDRESISFGEGRQATRAAIGFLDKLGPNDKVAFTTVPPSAGFVDFTSNRQLVRNALEQMVGVASRPHVLLNIGIYEAYSIDHHSDTRTEAQVISRFCGQIRNPLAYEECEIDVRSQAATIAGEIRNRVDTSLRSLRGLLESLRDVDGPKSIVWISEGLVIDGPGGELAEIGHLAAAANATVNVLMLDSPLADVTERDRSPSVREDRDMEKRGLELLAGMARGGLFPIAVNADSAFDRIENELSGYYLLGVESGTADRDGKRHTINVAVGRRGVTVRARREFQVLPETKKAENADDRLLRTLRSPFAIAELPLRLATYAYQDPNSPKVRVVVATEIERGDKETEKTPADIALGVILVDAAGRTIVSSVQHAKIIPVDSPRGPLLEHVGSVLVDPGTYTLKFAAVDNQGRRGSVEHPITAWQMTGVPFAVSDLMLADTPAAPGDPLKPAAQARLASGRLTAYLELYADRADFFGNARVNIEVAASESSPTLASATGRLLSATGESKHRGVSANVPVELLPVGSYVARAIVTDGDRKIGQLIRPFEIVAMPPIPQAAPLGSMISAIGAFQRDIVLKSDVISFFMDVLDKGRPALKATTAQVRRGRFDGAARQAFDADDQLAAAFLRGLELFAKGDLNQAGTQFAAALRIAPDFAPASFYLGASYAAGGRDRDAITAWRRALAAADKLPVQYAVLGDALSRSGEGPDAIPPLRDALAAWPENDEVRRRLAMLQGAASQPREALATIEPYLERHPADHEALLVALHAIYATRAAGQTLLSTDVDRERMAKYARAYAAAKGPHDALVATWAAYIARR